MMKKHDKSTPKLIKQLYRLVNKTLKDNNLFPNEARILVACSGGPDSMVLLNVLQYLKVHRKALWTIGVTTMDHSIRRESLSELQMVASYCNKNNLPFWGVKKDIPTIAGERKESLETVGRCERYKWFNELAEREHYDYIVTAHHKDDQAETILAHILRGSGIKGITGMPVISLDYTIPIVRPLLEVTKNDLLEYAQLQDIIYCVDTSNDDLQFNRNRIRHEIIPKLQTINPNVVDALCRLGRIARVDADYLDCESEHLFTKIVKTIDCGYSLSRRSMRTLPLAMQRRLWQLMMPGISLSLSHQEQLAHIVRTGEAKTFFIEKVTINAQYDTIHVYCKH